MCACGAMRPRQSFELPWATGTGALRTRVRRLSARGRRSSVLSAGQSCGAAGRRTCACRLEGCGWIRRTAPGHRHGRPSVRRPSVLRPRPQQKQRDVVHPLRHSRAELDQPVGQFVQRPVPGLREPAAEGGQCRRRCRRQGTRSARRCTGRGHSPAAARPRSSGTWPRRRSPTGDPRPDRAPAPARPGVSAGAADAPHGPSRPGRCPARAADTDSSRTTRCRGRSAVGWCCS